MLLRHGNIPPSHLLVEEFAIHTRAALGGFHKTQSMMQKRFRNLPRYGNTPPSHMLVGDSAVVTRAASGRFYRTQSMLQKSCRSDVVSRLPEALRKHAPQRISRTCRGRSEWPTYDSPGWGRGVFQDAMHALVG